MADDGSQQSAAWPAPKFQFKVQIGQLGEISFQEISGLEIETQPIEYRAGDSKEFSVIKMPGIRKTSNVTMKRGVFAKDTEHWDWYNQIKSGNAQRSTITITLSDESGNPAMVWTLINAWPTKFTASDMKSDANEIAVESLEIAHEGITIAKS